MTINDIVPGLLVNATLKEVSTRNGYLVNACPSALLHQVTANGLKFTIFGVFEAHASIRHLPNGDYNIDGFVIKKKVSMKHLCSQCYTYYISVAMLQLSNIFYK